MDYTRPIPLGRTALTVGRLGISSSFGAPTAALEEAFERGCNYWTWGTFIKGRSKAMKSAIENIVSTGKRDKLVVAMLTYAHHPWFTDHYFHKGLKAASLDYADILLLGYFSKRPPEKIIDGALKLKQKGLVRFIGLTSHNRKLFPTLAAESLFDLFHIRYNASHRGSETDVFPYLQGVERPGVVSFTSTDWQKLLKARRMPPGEVPLTAGDCYRFVLSHPAVDVCMMGAKTTAQMRANLKILEQGPLTDEEMDRIKKIDEHIYRK